MNQEDFWLKKLETKNQQRQKKRHQAMKISGKSVLALKKIIAKKSAGS